MAADFDRLKDLILWARKERVAIHTLRVGDLAIDLTDMELAFPGPKPGKYESPWSEPPKSAYEAHARDMGLVKPTETA